MPVHSNFQSERYLPRSRPRDESGHRDRFTSPLSFLPPTHFAIPSSRRFAVTGRRHNSECKRRDGCRNHVSVVFSRPGHKNFIAVASSRRGRETLKGRAGCLSLAAEKRFLSRDFGSVPRRNEGGIRVGLAKRREKGERFKFRRCARPPFRTPQEVARDLPGTRGRVCQSGIGDARAELFEKSPRLNRNTRNAAESPSPERTVFVAVVQRRP